MCETSTPITLENENLLLAFDNRGRVTTLRNKKTVTSFLTYPSLEDNWKLLVLGSGHPVYYIHGREQVPVDTQRGEHGVAFSYRELIAQGSIYDIDVDFIAYLSGDEVSFEVKITELHGYCMREAWYPILGGFEGFPVNDEKNIVHFAKSRTLSKDILHKGLPGSEYVFVVDGETSQYIYPNDPMQWIDLFSNQRGIYLSPDDKSLATTSFWLEKYPPETGASGYYLQEPSISP